MQAMTTTEALDRLTTAAQQLTPKQLDGLVAFVEGWVALDQAERRVARRHRAP